MIIPKWRTMLLSKMINSSIEYMTSNEEILFLPTCSRIWRAQEWIPTTIIAISQGKMFQNNAVVLILKESCYYLYLRPFPGDKWEGTRKMRISWWITLQNNSVLRILKEGCVHSHICTFTGDKWKARRIMRIS